MLYNLLCRIKRSARSWQMQSFPTKSNWLQHKLLNTERCLRGTDPCQVCLLGTEKWKPVRDITRLGHAFTHSIKYVTRGLLLSGLNRAGNKASTTFSLPLMLYCKTGRFSLQRQNGTSEVQHRNLELYAAWIFVSNNHIAFVVCNDVNYRQVDGKVYLKWDVCSVFIYKLAPSTI